MLTVAESVDMALLRVDAGETDVDDGRAPLLDLNAAVIHQASGMVMVQTRGTMEDELIALQGFAYGTGRPLMEVAGDVVNRRIRFHEDGGSVSR